MKITRFCSTVILAVLFALPSVLVAQSGCTAIVEIEASLAAGQSATGSAFGTIELTTLEASLDWDNSPADGTYPSDITIYITDPNGMCVVWGGFNIQANGCDNIETSQGIDWPFGWNTTVSGSYSTTIDLSDSGLSGSGDWTIEIVNSWASSNGAVWDFALMLSGPCAGQCPDPGACNYVPEEEQLNPLDEACLYPDDLYGIGFDCNGACLADEDGDGICDEEDTCFGDLDECGECNGSNVSGCNDQGACNFDPLANCDDGSCLYIDGCGECGGTGIAGCTNVFACNFNSEATCDDGSCGVIDACGVCGGGGYSGCTDGTACNFDPEAACDDDSCLYLDAFGECGGRCAEDADEDGWCDACTQPDYSLEVEVVVSHNEGVLAGMTTYRVHLMCVNSSDELYSISSSYASPLVIESSSGSWFNSDANLSWSPSGLDLAEVANNPSLAYDSYLTIGASHSGEGPFAGSVPWTGADVRDEFEPGGGTSVAGGLGTIYLLNLSGTADSPGVAGDDNRVLVMQITTEGDIFGSLNVLVHPNGLTQNALSLTLEFDSNTICNDLDPCIGGELDECGVCDGQGAVYECGCEDIPVGECDCEGNQLDVLGVCGGSCIADEDVDGICDDVDDCVGFINECGLCEGPDSMFECGCSGIPEGDCDCDGSQLDALGVCGGNCEEDLNQNGICDVDENIGFAGFTAVLDTIWHGGAAAPSPELEFYGSYLIYAEFSHPTDVLSALYSDVEVLGTPLMGVDLECDCFESEEALQPHLWTNNPLVFGVYPELEFTTGWTIGLPYAVNDNASLQSPSIIGDLASPCAGAISADGALYVSPVVDPETDLVVGPSNAVAGPDLRVLVARITTCGSFEFQACVQSFTEGNYNVQTQYSCPQPLQVNHPYLDGTCVNDGDGDGICDEFEQPGCTNPFATNFSEIATEEDGSCTYSGNFQFACGPGTFWDEMTMLCLPIQSADLDLDGCVGTNDLLQFLSQFGACVD